MNSKGCEHHAYVIKKDDCTIVADTENSRFFWFIVFEIQKQVNSPYKFGSKKKSQE